MCIAALALDAGAAARIGTYLSYAASGNPCASRSSQASHSQRREEKFFKLVKTQQKHHGRSKKNKRARRLYLAARLR